MEAMLPVSPGICSIYPWRRTLCFIFTGQVEEIFDIVDEQHISLHREYVKEQSHISV